MTWLSVKEYAQALGVHPETVKRWIAKGDVQAIKIGEKGWWHIAQPTPQDTSNLHS